MGSYGTERSSGVFRRALATCTINVKVMVFFNFMRKIILPMIVIAYFGLVKLHDFALCVTMLYTDIFKCQSLKLS